MPTKIEKDAVTGTETTGHEWDGIKELNTPLPRWWLYVFYATVVFSIVWAVLYPTVPYLRSHSAGLLNYTQRDDVAEAIKAGQAGQQVFRDKMKGMELAAIKADPELNRFALAGGRVLFAENCAACHQSGGAGAKGYPNLADDDWLWGGKLADIQQTLQHGIRSANDADTRVSQMPRFLADGVLKASEIDAVADHVLFISGQAKTDSAAGAKLFADNCAACHGDAGKGNRELGAPNLTDKIWLYGGDKATIVATIANSRNGVMPAWTGRLDDTAIKMLALYVHALGGGE